MENQGPGLLSCDAELFQRVWSRVTEGEQIEAPPSLSTDGALVPAAPAAVPAQSALLSPAVQLPDGTNAALQQWVLRLLGDAAAYRRFSDRFRRSQALFSDLAREKRQGARTLAAEYFLRSGVRYWPRVLPTPGEGQPALPVIRRFYATERRREGELRAQAAQEEPELANRYLALADAAHSAANRLRSLLEGLF